MSMVLGAMVLAGEDKKSGPIGLAVILALCVICYFLFKSMSRHLRKVREEFPDDGSAEPSPGELPSATTAPDSDSTTAPTPSNEPDP
ncbi:MAG TPA: hypothetical protein VJ831_02530 [Jatrophihabitantaceae bacterium]|nr:hypothetical protein [Jatrophihabitantaceae bacterium]